MEHTALLKRISEITECSICAETFHNPKMIPCGHSFCLSCLEKYADGMVTGQRLQCPLCRADFIIPNGGLPALINNFTVENLMDLSRVRCSAADAPLCDVCSHVYGATEYSRSVAVQFCVECKQMLCEHCVSRHGAVTGTRLHSLMPMGSDVATALMRSSHFYCDDHADETVSFYCSSCAVTVCDICHTVSHSKHNCIDLVSATRDFSKLIFTEINTADARIAKLKHDLLRLEQENDALERDATKTESAVKQAARELRSLVDRDEAELLKELHAVKTKNLKRIEAARKQLEKQLLSSNTFVDMAEKLRNKGSFRDMCSLAFDLLARAEELGRNEVAKTESYTAKLDFTLNDIKALLKAGSKNIVGKLSQVKRVDVEYGGTAAMHSTQSSAPNSLQKTQKTPAVLHTDYIPQPWLRNRTSIRGESIRGIAVVGRKVYIVRQPTTDIEVYNQKTLELQDRLPLTNVKISATDIVHCSRYNCLYVSTYYQKTMYRVELGTQCISNWSANGEMEGLSVTTSANVLVAFDDARQLKEFSTRGHLLRLINLDADAGNPYHTIELTSEMYLMCSVGSQAAVCTVSADGRVTACYSGVSSNLLRCASRLVVDVHGRVLVVCHVSNRVVLLDKSLKYVRDLLADGDDVKAPRTAFLHENSGMLFVGLDSGELNAYKVQNI